MLPTLKCLSMLVCMLSLSMLVCMLSWSMLVCMLSLSLTPSPSSPSDRVFHCHVPVHRADYPAGARGDSAWGL